MDRPIGAGLAVTPSMLGYWLADETNEFEPKIRRASGDAGSVAAWRLWAGMAAQAVSAVIETKAATIRARGFLNIMFSSL